MAVNAAPRDGTDTCTAFAGSTSLTGRKSLITRYSPVHAGCTRVVQNRQRRVLAIH